MEAASFCRERIRQRGAKDIADSPAPYANKTNKICITGKQARSLVGIQGHAHRQKNKENYFSLFSYYSLIITVLITPDIILTT